MNDQQQRLTKTHVGLGRPPFECVALVLQGGGALGAYQGGVYQALAEADIEPDWVAGISIGAINAALIAGNPPEKRIERLRAFWEGITAPNGLDFIDTMQNFWRGDVARSFFNQLKATGAVVQGAPGFFEPRVPPPYFQPAGTTEATSYYDTGELRGTLERLVDFDYLNSNAGKMRLSVGAVNVRSGNFVYFDTKDRTIKPEHVMASGALPPGFPAVEVEGELYWDGGLISNTPLQWVTTGADERHDTLAFQVDLWSSRGEAPADLAEVIMRQKEIQYSSRTRYNTDTFKHLQTVRRTLAEALDKVPAEWLDNEEGRLLKSFADRKVYSVVHLIYRSKNYEKQSKDYEFSALSMQDHWQAGYNDTVRSLRHPEALRRPTDRTGVAAFDLGVGARD
ncbi:MAG: patatin-like phospholipase family protein [Xanthobacteraceae bacterium]